MKQRPVLRYHGGKWLLAPWIISHFPPHRIYVEPFGGAASVLLQKPRTYAEIYNDLDGEIVNLFRVLRDSGPSIVRGLRDTPFSRDEYYAAMLPTADPLESARRLIVRSFMGFGSDSYNEKRRSGFRASSNRSGTTPAHDWRNFPETLEFAVERLRGVVIENRPALQVMADHDGTETLHYCDPPYMLGTRRLGNVKAVYRHEMTDDDHLEFLSFARNVRGSIVLSGYANPIYDETLGDWEKVSRPSLADGARKRTETLYLSPRVRVGGPLFNSQPATRKGRDNMEVHHGSKHR